MATYGSRNTAASSQALNVGSQIPTRGENASPIPAADPLNPLASAYVRTALMNANPTSGPMTSSSTHQAREALSSRDSFRSSHYQLALSERKKHLFECTGRSGARGERRQFVERCYVAHG